MEARIEVYPPQKQGTNLLANATVHFFGAMPVLIKGFRILNGQHGPWLAWPQRSTGEKDPQTGKVKYVNTAWSEDKGFRDELQALAIASYQAAQAGATAPAGAGYTPPPSVQAPVAPQAPGGWNAPQAAPQAAPGYAAPAPAPGPAAPVSYPPQAPVAPPAPPTTAAQPQPASGTNPWS